MGLVVGLLSLAVPYDEIDNDGCCRSAKGKRSPSQAPEIAFTGVPPGLEYLSAVSRICIKSDINLLKSKVREDQWILNCTYHFHKNTGFDNKMSPDLLFLVIGFNANNAYAVLNQTGERVYVAAEVRKCCNRVCMGRTRAFVLNILDATGSTVMTFQRSCKCGSGGCNRIEATATVTGEYLGHVLILHTSRSIVLHVFNGPGELVFIIKLVGGGCCACRDVKFDVLLPDGVTKIGQIAKLNTGTQEWSTDADNFGVEFPVDLDVRLKAVLCAAVFFILSFKH